MPGICVRKLQIRVVFICFFNFIYSMELTPLQLKIQKYADRTLSTWCLIYEKIESKRNVVVYINSFDVEDDTQQDCVNYLSWDQVKTTNWWRLVADNILWHPMSRGRLCFLWTIEQNKNFLMNNARNKMTRWFWKNLSMYQKNILERPEEIQKLVMQFLLTLTKK